jgi:hypothetical protein
MKKMSQEDQRLIISILEGEHDTAACEWGHPQTIRQCSVCKLIRKYNPTYKPYDYGKRR